MEFDVDNIEFSKFIKMDDDSCDDSDCDIDAHKV